ncbi:PASTA domain-containing protein [Nakamurella sp.]|uniref:PASTA domain-containing protein n=1 Tax=Nakamurella sp. TaxID=1869182 RepID=UPI003B3A1998
MKFAARLVAIGLPVALLLGACGSGGTATPAAVSTPSSAEAAPASSAVPSSTPATTTRPTTSSPTSSVAAPKVMPDYTGQSLSAAQAALAPYNVRIKTVNRIDSQPAGTVIEQDPVAGAPFAQLVTLTVSTAPAAVPDVTGQTYADAEERLTKLGFEVKENPIFDQKLADGLVQGQNPPAGTANTAEVTLDVVRRPVVTYLADMEAVDRENYESFNSGSAKANGKSYSHAVAIAPYANGNPGTIEYDFSRQYRTLTGELGLGDKSDSAAVGKVEIYGDGRQLLAQDVPFGTTTPVDVDVTDVLRIKIVFSTVDGRSTIVFGDFAAQGLQSEVGSSGSATPTSTSR